MIGATIAAAVFRGRVHIGYLAALVAASNAGGAGSVVGDTTTTMMWLDGVSPLDVLHAYVAAVAAFIVFAIPAARQQQRYSPIQADPDPGIRLDVSRLVIVAGAVTVVWSEAVLALLASVLALALLRTARPMVEAIEREFTAGAREP